MVGEKPFLKAHWCSALFLSGHQYIPSTAKGSVARIGYCFRFYLAMPFSQAQRHFLQVLIQIGLIVGIFLFSSWLSQNWLHGIPPGIVGIAIALALLGLGLLRREWVADGATWLLREMLLFFIPVTIAIIQYPSLMLEHGFSILWVIVASTACVMISTAFAVDLCWRLERRWRGKQEEQQS